MLPELQRIIDENVKVKGKLDQKINWLARDVIISQINTTGAGSIRPGAGLMSWQPTYVPWASRGWVYSCGQGKRLTF